MINNRKAYRIFMSLPKEKRKELQVQHEIECIDNYENKSWNNRFGKFAGSFWIVTGKQYKYSVCFSIINH